MSLRSVCVAIGLIAAFGLGLLSVPALSGTAQPVAKCTASQHAKYHRSLAAFKKQMAKSRAAYFRTHKSAKLRAKFVKAQNARLAALTKAAGCKVVKPTTTTRPKTTTVTTTVPAASTSTTVTTTVPSVVTTTTTIDGAPPDTSISWGAASPTNLTGATFGFVSTEAGSSFECQLDGAGFSACASPKSYAGLGEGAHTFEVRATDPAGNTDASPARYAWTIDLSAPDTNITSGPASSTNATGATFSFSSSEGGSSFDCRLDGGGFVACTSPHSYSGLAGGSHSFQVRATDPAGNTDASPAGQTWSIVPEMLQGGTLKFNMSATDVDFTDPSLAYGTISWQLEYATALKLYNYPDVPAPEGGRIAPEAAAGFPLISADGRTYTITVRPGFRFSDGRAVTAENFAFAINRALSPVMQSPAAPFITNIAGAQDVIDGKAQTASGVRVDGDKLIIELTQPDGGLLAKLAMPFFQALPTNLALDKNGVNAYPSAGPYYISERTTGRHITVNRNPYYTGARPAYADVFDITVNTNLDQSLLQVKSGEVDYDLGGLPATAHADLGLAYGVNAPNGRYHVHQLVETDYIALNTSRPPFSNVNLRKAFNYALDRPAMIAVRGAYAAMATDQILPPGMGGFRDVDLYPLDGPDLVTARALAGDSCGTVKLWTGNSAVGQNLGQVAKHSLEQIGCTVEVTLFQGFQIYTAAGQRGADFDAVLVGWNQDYPDPYDFLDVLLNGDNIHDSNNNNLAYFNNPAINAKLDAANLLVGADRYNAYGELDVEIMRDHAPWVPYDNRNEREFTGARLGGYLFQPANASADLNHFYLTASP